MAAATAAQPTHRPEERQEGRVTERDNEVLGAVLLRDFGPFIPVWLFGVVLAVALDYESVGGSHLVGGGWVAFVPVYSAVVLALVMAGFLRHYGHCPSRIEIGERGVRGFGPRRGVDGSARTVNLDFSNVFAVHEGGLFGPRVEARRPGGGWEWFFLTPRNALDVRDAWRASANLEPSSTD
ncbi:MAG: hypothetical protein L3K08_08465 [Thermoplasmata archaeon]|nr:hypothetical protein [Thermoplasmata archaeon]